MVFPIQFLIDECVSPILASDARDRSYQAAHVNDRGLTRQPDYRIFRKCLSDDLVLVTNNGKDFLPLYAGAELHSGLVILLPSVELDDQRRLFGIVLDWIGEQTDLVNMLIEIGEDAILRISQLSRSES